MYHSHSKLLIAFGTAVRTTRKANSLTQQELADRASLHRTYIADIERGRRNVSLVNITALARALGISASKLLSGIEAEAPAEMSRR
jgi:transcriptional regulator with XRE-family HTH domain